MNFLETYDLSVTTLSPIHIGCGEDFEPTNYVIEGNRLYVFDPVQLLRILPREEQEEFAKIVAREDSLRAVQKFFYRHRKDALKMGRCAAKVAEAVQDFYNSRIGTVAQREPGKNVLNKLEIARTAFNPLSGQPVLPGSSIKGAIRTALLDELLRGRGYPVQRDNKLMVQEVFDLGTDSKRHFSRDPFRFLKISDGTFCPKIPKRNPDGSIQQVERLPRICFQVNRKKRPNKYDASGTINTLLECIPANTARAFTAQWVIERKVIEHKAGGAGQLPCLQLDFETVAAACNRFYTERLQAEMKIHNSTAKWAADMGKMMAPGGFLKKMIDNGQGFLLRVGRHSGAESVTVNAPRNIKIMKGKGEKPEYAQEATTLWLAADQKDQMENMQPFGWVFITRNEKKL